MQTLRSLLFTIFLFLSVFVFGGWVLLAVPFGRSASYLGAIGWVRFNFWFARLLFGLRFEVIGRENIPDENCVAYLKHSSTWETLAEVLVFPEQTWVVKRELYWLPYFGWALAALRPIAINRSAHSTAVKQVLAKGSKAIDRGRWVMIFPEGTRMAPGTTRRYGLSGALLAAQNGRPIVPVAHNAEDFWPRGGMLQRGGTVRMVIGKPIPTVGRDAADINADARSWMDETMRQISPAYTTTPAET